VDFAQILTAVGFLGGMSFLLALVLALANRKLAVAEDPRIDTVEDMLPHANCGACGFPGCRAFANAVVDGSAVVSRCTVSSPAGLTSIAQFLGVDAGEQVRRVARLACAGGINVSRSRALYLGQQSCRAAALVAGGNKLCTWGCLGFGDCVDVCDFNALHLDAFKLPVVTEDVCTACNACVTACPKDLFSLEPVDNRLWVACKSQEAGDTVQGYCEVGCTACARCVADAPPQLITMQRNLPVVNYSQPRQSPVPTARCPTGAIVWQDPKLGAIRGEGAPVIARTQPLSATVDA